MELNDAEKQKVISVLLAMFFVSVIVTLSWVTM